MTGLFIDRKDAGRQLAAELAQQELRDPVVIALPRGGVPVAFEIAKTLRAPLDVLLVRKIRAPYQPELALGAVAEGDPPYIEMDEALARRCGASDTYVEHEKAHQLAEIGRRRVLYGTFASSGSLGGKTAVLVDDGIATGATVRAALLALRSRDPAELVLAVPVAPADTLEQLQFLVDRMVCLHTPAAFWGVGGFYSDFTQVEDETVVDLLRTARRWHS